VSFAIVFPGQGSQSLGMLSALAEAQAPVRETFSEASEALGLDLWALVQQGPEADLNRTENTQPAMLAGGVAVWRAWRAAGGELPVAMAGHSLGEYTALVCAEALDFAAAVRLVATRGRLMQAAVPEGEGAMAAVIGLDDAAVTAACEQAAQGEVVEPVNYNAPGQVVIAGSRVAVDRAMEAARAAGAKRVLPLPVSAPSHCMLMRDAALALGEALAEVELRAPTLPVIHNADVQPHDTPEAIRDVLTRQLHSPVRWVETIRALAGQGVTQIVELGPGKVLAGLNKRIERSLSAVSVNDPEGLAAALAATREEPA
jgi:[acyl-carrier-protein] S-malonyltransferase